MNPVFFILLFVSIAVSKDIKVFHFTDIHAELDYEMGKPAVCVEGPCCRIDSVAKNESYAAPRYGDHHCDNAPDFIQDSFDFFARYFEENPDKKPDYILMTGDQATHRKKSTQSAELNIKLVRYVFETYKKYFGQYSTIPVFGNHDTFPEGHMLLPPENKWMTEVMADLWKDWVPMDQMDTIIYGGYYTMTLRKGWRIIGINSLWEYVENTEVEHVDDPAEQNAFVRKWLDYARHNNETVWIVGHISPGSSVFEPYNTFMSELMHEYSDVVVASFYGHTHMNEFYIVRDTTTPERIPLHVNFVTPAFEGLGGNNPGACLFIVDEETKKVKDYIVYTADFDEMRKSGELAWKEVYSIKDVMKVKDLSPKSVVEWAEQMWDNEEMFQEYMSRYYTGDYVPGSCDHKCKVNNLCSLLYITKQDRDECKSSH